MDAFAGNVSARMGGEMTTKRILELALDQAELNYRCYQKLYHDIKQNSLKDIYNKLSEESWKEVMYLTEQLNRICLGV